MKNNINEVIERDQKELISQLKERRKKLGYTQCEVAKKAGIPQSTIGRLESGALSPRADTLINIGLALGLKLTYVDDSKKEC